MFNFSFFGNKYGFGYRFLNETSRLDIADEQYNSNDISIERIKCFESFQDKITNFEMFFNLIINNYKIEKTEKRSTMQTSDKFTISIDGLKVIFQFNLSILNRISSVKVIIHTRGKTKTMMIHDIVKFEYKTDEILNEVDSFLFKRESKVGIE